MIVLGIETTCDETAIALVKDGEEVLSNVIASSADLHAQYGGVFPEQSSRRHIESIISVLKEALGTISPDKIDLIAVAKGPGLAGPLLIGMQFAKGLSISWKKPFIGINHVEAHLYAAMMGAPKIFPALGLVLSGGHTMLVKIHAIGHYELLSTTVDDALGEAFDKVGVLLGMPYPGGPRVEALAKNGHPRFALAKGVVKAKPLDFSFSGLKTSVLYAIKGQNGKSPISLSEQDKCDLAASFQETALNDVLKKAHIAAATFDCHALYFGGGVCNNGRLKEMFNNSFQSKIPLFFPKKELTSDNGAMIAGLGYRQFIARGCGDPLDLEITTRIPF